MMDEIRALITEEERSLKHMAAGKQIIPRLIKGSSMVKRAGRPLEITEPLFNAFKLRYCPACHEGEKFLIFKYVAVCMICNEFYFITR